MGYTLNGTTFPLEQCNPDSYMYVSLLVAENAHSHPADNALCCAFRVLLDIWLPPTMSATECAMAATVSWQQQRYERAGEAAADKQVRRRSSSYYYKLHIC